MPKVVLAKNWGKRREHWRRQQRVSILFYSHFFAYPVNWFHLSSFPLARQCIRFKTDSGRSGQKLCFFNLRMMSFEGYFKVQSLSNVFQIMYNVTWSLWTIYVWSKSMFLHNSNLEVLSIATWQLSMYNCISFFAFKPTSEKPKFDRRQQITNRLSFFGKGKKRIRLSTDCFFTPCYCLVVLPRKTVGNSQTV